MTYCKKVLVTGATGLIGKELITPLLNRGFKIYAIRTKEDPSDNKDVNWVTGNLFDEVFIGDIMKEIKPEYLLNMAWATTGDYLSSDINYKFLTAGLNLIRCFKENGGKKAVYAGTCFEYKFKNEKLKETDELDAMKNNYVFCKNKLHEIVGYYCQNNKIDFGWGRIFYVYGHNEDKTRLTGMVIDKLSHNEEVVITSGPLQKDYMYTKDIAAAFAAFLDSGICGTVNICTGRSISIKEYVLTIADKLNKRNLIKFRDDCTNQPNIIIGNNDRLIKEIGFVPQYNLAQALEEIIKQA